MPKRVEIVRSMVSDNYLVMQADIGKEFLENPGDVYAITRCLTNAIEVVGFLVAKDPTLVVSGRAMVPAEYANSPESVTNREYVAGVLHGMAAILKKTRANFSDDFIRCCMAEVENRDTGAIVMDITTICGDLDVPLPRITFPE